MNKHKEAIIYLQKAEIIFIREYGEKNENIVRNLGMLG